MKKVPNTLAVSIFVERLEKIAAQVEISPEQWKLILWSVLPEWYADPRRPATGGTREQPGSDGKIRVLSARLRGGLQLYHPDDETFIPPAER